MNDVVLDLPIPPSINRTGRMDWRSMTRRNQWENDANALALLNRNRRKITGKFEVRITVSEFLQDGFGQLRQAPHRLRAQD